MKQGITHTHPFYTLSSLNLFHRPTFAWTTSHEDRDASVPLLPQLINENLFYIHRLSWKKGNHYAFIYFCILFCWFSFMMLHKKLSVLNLEAHASNAKTQRERNRFSGLCEIFILLAEIADEDLKLCHSCCSYVGLTSGKILWADKIDHNTSTPGFWHHFKIDKSSQFQEHGRSTVEIYIHAAHNHKEMSIFYTVKWNKFRAAGWLILLNRCHSWSGFDCPYWLPGWQQLIAH